MSKPSYRKRIVIMGAAGRDFHNFNAVFRDDPDSEVVAYSDIPHVEVMHKASIALAAGADFILLSPERTMLTAKVPVIACCAGCGKSQTTQWLSRLLKRHGLRVAVIRHPMPYGDLEKQAVQRIASRLDLAAADCAIEEREEYKPHLN